MSDSVEPRWDLLPHEPEQFFGLPDGFDRKELKRRYNALLRQFKPEKYPEEFQRLRAAFEQLDNRLRYGEQRSERGSMPVSFDWMRQPAIDGTDENHEPDPSTELHPSNVSPKPKPRELSPLEQLQLRLKSESAAEVYRQLEQEPKKTPFDFFALAILSDVVQSAAEGPDGSMSFLKWLLRGVKQFSGDYGLNQLLSALLHSDLPLAQLPKILSAVAQAVPNDHWYSLTEPLWDRLLQERPFAEVAQLLAECEGLLRDHRLDGKLTFYIHILRRAVWLANDEWLNNAFGLLEDNASEIGGRLEYDFEFLQFLRTYRTEREKFLNGTTGREMIDQALRDYCVKSDYAADLAVLECQLALATESDWLRQAFPTTDDSFPAWWMLWNWITSDVADRLGEPESEVNPETVFHQLRKVLRRCEQVTDTSRLSWGWQSIGILYLGAAALGLLLVVLPVVIAAGLLLTLVMTAMNSTGGNSDLLAIVATVIVVGGAMTFVFFRYVRPRTADRLRRWMATRLGARSYFRQWRPLIEQHLRLTHHPFHLLVDQLSVEHDDINQVYTSWIRAHVSSDYGLACLTLAMRFLR